MTGIFRTPDGSHRLFQPDHGWRIAPASLTLDSVFEADDPESVADAAYDQGAPCPDIDPVESPWAPPVGSQEIWAAGVTYFRSRTARMEEAEQAGGDIFYDKVYEAARPELFFKATPARARGHHAAVGIRRDSTWDVPEPELTLAISRGGKVFGCTIGNDMSSRSIEGENPLYLPQAKVYTGSCGLGPALWVGLLPGPDAAIRLSIRRSGQIVFTGQTQVSQLKRGFDELASWLFRHNEFPHGALLMTGTGVVPDSDFTLAPGDETLIAIDGLGELRNAIEAV
jgi:2-dehydro-3-deoxy-D-arabinonate dehydratase